MAHAQSPLRNPKLCVKCASSIRMGIRPPHRARELPALELLLSALLGAADVAE
eukprot:CAMPEP_0176200696 /NCGR_PEP_ID=MMETSP0121_2-20121125/9191_1 /TAXON_ID=160619 /ORGANISM="Kryptoperidinium foliaceum, Strain CCMP 1326" /LENGTH=52 /DNA_ID=CAMNT_0017539565 /DNA_START=275 /DNA_END=430 /DNA_ORIENTATION=+